MYIRNKLFVINKKKIFLSINNEQTDIRTVNFQANLLMLMFWVMC